MSGPLPLDFICPIRCAHLTLLDVPRMAGFEGCTLLGILICLGTLLPKSDELHLVALFGQYDVRLLRMLWSGLGFIDAFKAVLLE